MFLCSLPLYSFYWNYWPILNLTRPGLRGKVAKVNSSYSILMKWLVNGAIAKPNQT